MFKLHMFGEFFSAQLEVRLELLIVAKAIKDLLMYIGFAIHVFRLMLERTGRERDIFAIKWQAGFLSKHMIHGSFLKTQYLQKMKLKNFFNYVSD